MNAKDELRAFLPPGEWKYNGRDKFLTALKEDKILYQGCQDFIAAKSAENRIVVIETDEITSNADDDNEGISLEGVENNDDRGDA